MGPLVAGQATIQRMKGDINSFHKSHKGFIYYKWLQSYEVHKPLDHISLVFVLCHLFSCSVPRGLLARKNRPFRISHFHPHASSVNLLDIYQTHFNVFRRRSNWPMIWEGDTKLN